MLLESSKQLASEMKHKALGAEQAQCTCWYMSIASTAQRRDSLAQTLV